MLVFPKMIAPASLRRATTLASSSGTKPESTLAPPVVRSPRVRQRSLTATGTPWSGPRERPADSSSLGNASLGEDPLGVERDERVQRRLEALTAPEQRLAKIDGRERPGSQPGAELRDPEDPRSTSLTGSLRLCGSSSNVLRPGGSSERPQSRAPARGSRRAIRKPRARPARVAAARRRSDFGGRPATPTFRRRAALAEPSVEYDLHTGGLAETPPEVLVELPLIAAHDDEDTRAPATASALAGIPRAPSRP